MADIATARSAARLIAAHLDGDTDTRATELATPDPAALADAVAELAAHALIALTDPGQPGQLPAAMMTALAETVGEPAALPPLIPWYEQAARHFEAQTRHEDP